MNDKLKEEAGKVAGVLNMTLDEYIEGLVKQDLYQYRDENGEISLEPISDDTYLIRHTAMFGRPYLAIVKDGQTMKVPE